MKKNIEIYIDSLKIEGIDIRNIHQIKDGIEQELTTMILQNGFPVSDNSISFNALSSSPLRYSHSLSLSNVARNIAGAIYSSMGNSVGGTKTNSN